MTKKLQRHVLWDDEPPSCIMTLKKMHRQCNRASILYCKCDYQEGEKIQLLYKCCYIFLHLLEQFIQHSLFPGNFVIALSIEVQKTNSYAFIIGYWTLKCVRLFLQYLVPGMFYFVTNLSNKENHSMYSSVHTRWTVERPPASLFSIGNWWNILGCDCGPGLNIMGWKLVALFLEGHLLHLDKRLLNRNRVAN